MCRNPIPKVCFLGNFELKKKKTMLERQKICEYNVDL